MRSLVIKNGSVLTAGGDLRVCDILIRNGTIEDIGEGLSGDMNIDAGGLTVVPGLIDIHTHGIGRVLTEVGKLEDYARIEASRGATTFFPTLFAPPDASADNLKRHLEETDNLEKTPQVGGFRLESPYLAYTGAGISKDLAPISAALTKKLLDAGSGHIRIWDVSPELVDAPALIDELSRLGIVCSLAHTQASIEQARAAVDAGAKLVTHLFDTFVLPEITDPDPGVYPVGLVDYLLVEDRVTCEIIGDGTHVYPILVEKTFRCKSTDRVVFVTDSNYGAGLPAGRYLLPGSWGNVEIKGPNDAVRMLDRDMEIAGSALTPIDNFGNAVRLFGKDIAAASAVCSKTPAKLLGLNKGEIGVGRDGDVIVVDNEFGIHYTVVGGEIVYQSTS